MVGGGNKIGLVRGEKIEHCPQHRAIAQPGTQVGRRQAGQCEQTFGARAIGQHPAERTQRKSKWIDGRGLIVTKN